MIAVTGTELIASSTLGYKRKPIGTIETCWAVWPAESWTFPKLASAGGPLDSCALRPLIATALWAA